MIEMACPRCHTALEPIAPTVRRCPKDGDLYHRAEGIWQMLPPERRAFFAKFIQEYETVREREGRGSQDASYYRRLPYHDSEAWHIRSKSFDAFLREVLEPLESASQSLTIIDLGAGNGWLSNRLAVRGHDVAAVDLTVNDFDGLGCKRFFEANYLAVQAEFEALPFAECQADLIIFNASFHYSINYADTLRESLRVLKRERPIIVLDTPIYRHGSSGAQMVKEREQQFMRQYGFASDSLPSENYLTWAQLDELARSLDLVWQKITPQYGLRWGLKPVAARILGMREPAQFHILRLARET